MAFNPFVNLGRVILIAWLLLCQMITWKAWVDASHLEFCGRDLKTYCVASDVLATDDVLHCGNCGSCSNHL